MSAEGNFEKGILNGEAMVTDAKGNKKKSLWVNNKMKEYI